MNNNHPHNTIHALGKRRRVRAKGPGAGEASDFAMWSGPSPSAFGETAVFRAKAYRSLQQRMKSYGFIVLEVSNSFV